MLFKLYQAVRKHTNVNEMFILEKWNDRHDFVELVRESNVITWTEKYQWNYNLCLFSCYFSLNNIHTNQLIELMRDDDGSKEWFKC